MILQRNARTIYQSGIAQSVERQDNLLKVIGAKPITAPMKRILLIIISFLSLISCEERVIEGKIVEIGKNPDYTIYIHSGKVLLPIRHQGESFFIIKTDSCYYKVLVDLAKTYQYNVDDKIVIATHRFKRIDD